MNELETIRFLEEESIELDHYFARNNIKFVKNGTIGHLRAIPYVIYGIDYKLWYSEVESMLKFIHVRAGIKFMPIEPGYKYRSYENIVKHILSNSSPEEIVRTL